MPWSHLLAWPLMVLFVIGVIGCVVSIPIVAAKFFSVLFEEDVPKQAGQQVQPEVMPPPSAQRGD